MIIDAHTHIAALAASPFAGQAPDYIAQRLVEEMKRAGVARSIVLAHFESGKPSQPDTAKLLRLINGTDCLSAVASIDLSGPVTTTTNLIGRVNAATLESLDQLEVWVRSRAVVGVKLYPGYQSLYPINGRWRWIYEICQIYDIPVIFHSGDTLITETGARVKYAHPLAIDDVAVEYPTLKIVIAHVGNPWTVDCAELLYRHKNVYADLSGLYIGPPDPLDGDRDYKDLLRRRIRDLVAYASPSRLLFGSDWPLVYQTDYIRFVESLDLGDERMRERVMWRNAAELFRLPEADAH